MPRLRELCWCGRALQAMSSIEVWCADCQVKICRHMSIGVRICVEGDSIWNLFVLSLNIALASWECRWVACACVDVYACMRVWDGHT